MKTAALQASILDRATASEESGNVARSHTTEGQNLRLTPRQLEVLALLCEGLPNKLICRRLSISAGTVKAHISGILRELGVASRLQAVVAARRSGLLGEAASASVGLGAGSASMSARTTSATVTALDFGQRVGYRTSLIPQRT